MVVSYYLVTCGICTLVRSTVQYLTTYPLPLTHPSFRGQARREGFWKDSTFADWGLGGFLFLFVGLAGWLVGRPRRDGDGDGDGEEERREQSREE